MPGCIFEEECDVEDVDSGCLIGGINNNLDFHLVNEQTNFQLNHAIQASTTGAILGLIQSSYDNNDDLVIKVNANEGFSLSGYILEVRLVDSTTGEMSETCREISCTNDAPGDTISETFVNVQEGEQYYVRLNAAICPDDADQDGIPDATDFCPQVPGPATNAGCPIDTECVFEEECDIADAEPSCVTLVTQSGDFRNPDFVLISTQLSGVGLYDLGGWASNYGFIYSEINDEGNLEIKYQDVYGTVPVSSIVIEVRPAAPGTFLMSETCREIICSTDVSAEDVFVFNNIELNDQYYYLRVKAVACPPDTDLDGLPDALDACPQVPGPASNSGCPE